jgi:hypothetical protein
MSRVYPAWLWDWTDKVLWIGEKSVKVEKQVTEYENLSLGQRVVLSLGKREDNGMPVTLKIRYESAVSGLLLSRSNTKFLL